MKRQLPFAKLMLSVSIFATAPSEAAFHLWDITEIYSNSTGTLQFIEFQTTFGNQQFVAGHDVTVFNVGSTLSNLFTIASNLPGDSANRRFLLGTSGLQAAGGPAPDFIIPDNFLFTAGGSISFFGTNSGAYTALPTDGSLSRVWSGGNQVNSPTNFAGQTGTVPEPAGVLLFASGAFLLTRRRRTRGA